MYMGREVCLEIVHQCEGTLGMEIMPLWLLLGRDPGFNKDQKKACFVQLYAYCLSMIVCLCFSGRPRLRGLVRLLVRILALVWR